MNREDLHERMPVMVTSGYTARHTVQGEVVKVARRYVTIAYGLMSETEFDIETQTERGYAGPKSNSTYAAKFQTMAQYELAEREKAVRDGLREFGLLPKYTGPTTRFTLTLDDMAAVLDLLRERYPDGSG